MIHCSYNEIYNGVLKAIIASDYDYGTAKINATAVVKFLDYKPTFLQEYIHILHSSNQLQPIFTNNYPNFLFQSSSSLNSIKLIPTILDLTTVYANQEISITIEQINSISLIMAIMLLANKLNTTATIEYKIKGIKHKFFCQVTNQKLAVSNLQSLQNTTIVPVQEVVIRCNGTKDSVQELTTINKLFAVDQTTKKNGLDIDNLSFKQLLNACDNYFVESSKQSTQKGAGGASLTDND